MISQVACVPRICQSCRQGLLLRRNPTFSAARFFHPDTVLQRRGNDASVVQSKARIEALISGKPWEEEKPSGGRKRRNTPKSRRIQDDELPDWGLSSEQKKPVTEKKKPVVQKKRRAAQKPKAFRDRDGETSTSRSNIHSQLYDLSPTISRSKNSNMWKEAAAKGLSDVEGHRISRGKSTTNYEENWASKIEEIKTDAKEYDEGKTTPTATVSLEDDRPSNNEIVSGNAPGSLGASPEDVPSNSLGFTPESISITGAETFNAEAVSTAQAGDDSAIAEADEGSADSERPRSYAKREFKHQHLEQRNISISALGEDISALVLSNPDKLKRKTNPVVSLPRDRGVLGSELDWTSLLDDTDALDDISVQVRRNIEEFRPKDSSVIKAKDFKKIIRALFNGFTNEQLAAYFRQTLETSSRATNETPKYPWLVKQTTWVPSNPELLGPLSPKQKVAYLILKEAWALDIQEQNEGLGAVSVTLRPDVFELISNPSTGALKSLQYDILDESSNEDIVANEKKHELGIYARKASVRTILSRIDEAAASMRTQELSVQGVDSLDLQKDVLARLSSITKTSIQYRKEDSILNVKWLDQHSPAANTKPSPSGPSLQVESPPDIVLRLLLQDRYIRDRFQSTSDYCVLPPSETAMFMPHGREVRSLSWRNKLRTWSRYVMPVGKSSSENTAQLKLSSSKRLLRKTSKLKTDGPQVRFAATFGHILHSDAAAPSPSKRKKTTGHRVLLPVLPHPAAFTRLIGKGKANPPLSKSSSIVLNFIPTQHDSKAPEVRLSLPVNADDDFSDFTMSDESKLYAISPIHQQDFLCPRESVDVRVTQQSELPLDLAKQSHIREFFRASEFNLVEGRLRTPSHTQISLPAHLLPEPSKDAQTASEVGYTFAGLEIHQTMDLEWHDHILRYNSIEAGQHGGTRQELSLQAVQDPNGPTNAVHRSQFLHAVNGIVTGKFFSWTEGYKAIRKLPEEHELDSEQNQGYKNMEGLKVDTPDFHPDDTWSHASGESHVHSAEPTSIYEQSDRTLESGEELSLIVRQALSGEEGLQSTRYTNQGEDAIRAGERLVRMIEEALAQEAAPVEGGNITSDDHHASISAITQAEDVLRTTEQLTITIEESLEEQKSQGREETLGQEATPPESDSITFDDLIPSSTLDEAENGLRTAEQLVTIVEEAVEKQKSDEGVDGRNTSTK
ncbi:unnamed protein product [Clonostachys rhizophaga]|uniref:Mitochondrial inner-membrane-bound regulator-domain-containing protein n=1 Tax=Clonostachys rhizophaga TaxID=160324 RepID=A0A9N9V6Y3_9HYPO|nr:unnamed protein product [Clonostachys rhizophaga]